MEGLLRDCPHRSSSFAAQSIHLSNPKAPSKLVEMQFPNLRSDTPDHPVMHQNLYRLGNKHHSNGSYNQIYKKEILCSGNIICIWL